MICGELWPDALSPEGDPVTCHLEVEGHGPHHRWFHHSWQQEGDAAIAWHTEFGKKISVGIGPTVRETGASDITHEVVHHPTHVMLQNNLPAKPTP